jgi:peptide/nickel transport system substrate-binding protein
MIQTRRTLAAWSILIAIALVLAACGGGATPTAAPVQPTAATQPTVPDQPTAAPQPTDVPATAEPTVLHFGWLGKPDTLNPAYAFLVESTTILDLVYNTLLRPDQSGKYAGDLAKEWSVSEDGLTWTFKLHDNVTWHDDTPLTAEDVAWTINAVINDPDGWATNSGYVAGFKEVTAPDPQTVVITVDEPISNMEYRVSYLTIVSRQDFEQFKTAEDLQNFANDNPLGSGPFKLTTFDKDKGVIILDANPDYFLGGPKVDQVIFQTFDNENALVQALKVGDVDALVEVPSTGVDPLKKSDGVHIVQQTARDLSELIINSAPADRDPAPTRNPALDDPQVRLAIAQAINKQDLVDIVLQGLGKPGASIVPPTLGGGFWYSPNITDVPFDLDKANQTLEEAGYVKGGDGVRAKGETRLEFRLQYPSDSDTAPRVADLLTSWFMEAGIKVTPESVDPDSLTAACCPAGDFDLILWGWTADPDPDFMLSIMTSDQFTEGGWSDSGYSNPKYDEMYVQQQKEIDPQKRQQIVWEMQEMIFNDRPYIVYWYSDVLQAFRSDRFKNFIESPHVQIQDADSLLQVEPVQ